LTKIRDNTEIFKRYLHKMNNTHILARPGEEENPLFKGTESGCILFLYECLRQRYNFADFSISEGTDISQLKVVLEEMSEFAENDFYVTMSNDSIRRRLADLREGEDIYKLPELPEEKEQPTMSGGDVFYDTNDIPNFFSTNDFKEISASTA
jgi:hypothetical protein